MDALGKLFDIVPAWAPLDLQTARVGDWVSLKNWGHCTVEIFKGVGTDGDDPTFTLEQATAVAGTSAKNLATTTYYDEKEALTDLTGTGTWTRVTQSASQDVAPGDPSAQSAAIYIIEIDASDLDVNNSFDCLRVKCSDTGSNAQLGCAQYILTQPRFAHAPGNLPSSIID